MTRVDGGTGVATPTGSSSGGGGNTAAINAANANLTAAQQRASTTRDGISTLQTAYDSLNGQYESANTAATTAQSDYDKLQTQLQSLTTKVTTAQQGVDTAQQGVDTAKADVETATTALDTAKQQQETAQTKLDAAKQELDAAKEKRDTSKDTVKDAEKKFNDAKDALKKSQDAVKDATKDVDSATKKLADADKRVDEATKVVDTATKAVDTAQQRVTTAQQKLTDAQQKVTAAQQKVTAAESKVDTAQQALDTADERVDRAHDALKQADSELSSANKAVTDAQSALDKANNDVKSRETALATATAAVQQANTRVTNAEGALSAASGEVSSAQSALASAEARLRANPNDPAAKQAVASAKNRLNAAKAKESKARTELNNAKAEQQRAVEAERKAKQELEEAKRRQAEAERQLKEAQERQRRAEEAKAKAEEEVRQAEQAQRDAKAALEQAKQELKAAQDELKAAEEAQKTAEKELKDAQKELDDAKKDLEKAQKDLEKAKDEQTKAKDELTKAKEAQEKAQKEQEAAQKASDEAQKELDAAKKDLEQAETDLKAKEQAQKDAQKAVDDAKKAAEDAQKKVDEAKKKSEEAQKKLDEAKKDLEAAKKEQEELKAKADEAKKTADSKKQEAERLKAEAASKKQDLDSANARLKQAEAEVADAEKALSAAKSSKDAEAPKIEGDANHDGVLSDDERKKLADAAALDGALTPEEIAKLQKQQQDLIDAEQAARERYDGVDGVVTNSDDAARQAQLNKDLEGQATQEIIDERRRYYQQNPYYVDTNGTVFVASVDSSGNLQLQRTSSQPAQGGNPATQTDRTATIETNRNRTDVEKVTAGAGTTESPKRTQTTTVKTDPAGTQTSAQQKLEEDAKAADGSQVHRLMQEDYDAKNVRTQSVQEETTTTAAGDSTTNRVTTGYHEDGTSPAHVENEQSSKTKDGAEQSHVVDTRYARDGQTPTSQVVTDHSKETDGTERGTRAETDYSETGEPANTFIQRTGEREDGVPATEYVVWGPDGATVKTRVEGGTEGTREQFRAYLADGTQPPKHDLPEEPKPLEYADWLQQHADDVEADPFSYSGYGASTAYYEYLDDFDKTTKKEWEAERDRIQALNDQSDLRSVDPDRIINGEDPIRWTRQGDNRFTSESLGGRPLIEPLQPATDTPSVFDVPSQLQAAANAKAIDSSVYAKDPAKLQQLSEEQAAYGERLAAAKTDAERQQVMREYFSTHDYWIDRGADGMAEPVLMASAWSNGAPRSEMFGGSRATQPHATAARTGIEGTDDMDQPAIVDVVRNMYPDGSDDRIVRTSYDGPAGASRVVVDGIHIAPTGHVTEHDRNAQSMVSRTEEGKEPLAVTEITRERFDANSGLHTGEQYNAVATSDATMTTLEERRDTYDASGTIYDTKIDSTNMSRNYDADMTEDFLSANQAIIDRARDDHFNPNEDGEQVTVPPAGSYIVESHTDIDYDSKGQAIFQQVDETSTMVKDSGDDNHNGVLVTTTDTSRTSGSRGGSTVILDDDGKLIAPEDVTTSIRSTEFDPDAGTAGGNNGTGHQFRETTAITMHRTVNPDGTASDEWATPLTTQTLREGFDDDWVFDEKHIRTNAQGQVVNEDGEVATNENGGPAFLKLGDEYRDEHGNLVVAGADAFEDGKIPPFLVGEKYEIHHEDLDFADKFEEFMEGWGGRIVGVAAIVAGIGAAAFTGGASLALTAVGVGLASTSFAYTALNYSQGEASGWDLAIAGAGVALAALPAITSVKQLANASKIASEARLAGATDDVVRTLADDALRGSAGFGRTTETALKGAEAVEHGMDGLDAYDAGRAALKGDFWGAGMMLFAVGAGKAVGHVRGGTSVHAPDVPDVDLPDIATSRPNAGAGASPDVPSIDVPTIDSPATSQGAPTVRTNTPDAPIASTTRPITGTNTSDVTTPAPSVNRSATAGGADAAPASQVGGVHGDGVGAGAGSNGFTVAAAGVTSLTPATTPRPTEPTPADFSAHVDNPRADGVAPGDAWGGQERFDGHVDKHLGDYDPARYAAAGLELPTTRDGRPITDAATYHERALDYREMAVTGNLEDGVTSYPRANGGTMLVNSRTNEIAFINADGTVGSLYPLYNVKSRADGTYARNGNPQNRLDSYVAKELQSDQLVYAVRRAQQTGDAAGMQQALDSLQQLNPNRYDAMTRELAGTPAPSASVGAVAAPGAPQTIVGRLADGRVIVDDGTGNRTLESSASFLAANGRSVVPADMDLRVRRSNGNVEDGYRLTDLESNDGQVRMRGPEVDRHTQTLEVLSFNADRILGNGWIRMPDGSNGRILGYEGADGRGARFSVQLEDGQTTAIYGPHLINANADRLIGPAVSNAAPTGAHAVPRPDLLQLPGTQTLTAGTMDFGGRVNPDGSISPFTYGFRGGVDFQYQGVTIRIEGDPSLPSQHMADQLDSVRAAIDATPADLRADLRIVNVFEGRNPADPYWAEVRNMPGFVSDATGGQGGINYWNGLGNDPLGTFQHEVGHVFGLNGGPNNVALWSRAADLDRSYRNGVVRADGTPVTSSDPSGELMLGDSDSVSRYGQSAIDSQGLFTEDFAESVRLQLLSDRQGYIAWRRRSGIRGLFGSNQTYTFADLFPHRADALGGFRTMRLQGLDPMYYSPAWVNAPGIAGITSSQAGVVNLPSMFGTITGADPVSGLNFGAVPTGGRGFGVNGVASLTGGVATFLSSDPYANGAQVRYVTRTVDTNGDGIVDSVVRERQP